MTPRFDFVLQDPVQDGVASPAAPGTGKSKVKRTQCLSSGRPEDWKGDEWTGGGLLKGDPSPGGPDFSSHSDQSAWWWMEFFFFSSFLV